MAAKKVILDVDPGIDDAIALCLALFDPQFEVVAVTSAGGAVPADQATRNVQAIIEQLDPPRWPRIGAGADPDAGLPAHSTHLFGGDGLGNAEFDVAELHHRHPSEKVICDEAHAAPEQITLVTLGPLTNIARSLQRSAALPSELGQIVMLGGTVTASGNITPTAEFNIYCDPQSARTVFRSAFTKTLVPLDITSQVILTYNVIDQLPDESSRVGQFLRRILPYSLRAHRQHLGLEGMYVHGAVALAAATRPDLFEIEMVAADVELVGELTTGATVFDRRPVREWRSNLAVVTSVNVEGVIDYIVRGLAAAAAK